MFINSRISYETKDLPLHPSTVCILIRQRLFFNYISEKNLPGLRSSTRPADAEILNAAGWNTKKLTGKPATPEYFQAEELQLLNWLENNGYPFAKISLDSVSDQSGCNSALYSILKKDLCIKLTASISIGTAKISVDFMERYLGIPEGSIYKKDRLLAISRRILELPFVQEERPWNVNMLGTGSILNLYLKPKKSSQIDVLVGFCPIMINCKAINYWLPVKQQSC